VSIENYLFYGCEQCDQVGRNFVSRAIFLGVGRIFTEKCRPKFTLKSSRFVLKFANFDKKFLSENFLFAKAQFWQKSFFDKIGSFFTKRQVTLDVRYSIPKDRSWLRDR
jgi:hypothetical protein